MRSGFVDQMTPRVSPADLQLLLGARPPRAVLRWLYGGVRTAIADGRLAAGMTLPSTRAAAAQLGISRGTVVEAFDQLLSEGLLSSQPRSGMQVVQHAVALPRHSLADVQTIVIPSPGTPDHALFPRSAWTRAHRIAVQDAADSDFGYPDAQGLPSLRRAVAEHLRLSRGADADPERIVIVAGVAQALVLISAVLRARGALGVAVENPGSPGASNTLVSGGLSAYPNPVDRSGVVVSAIDPRASAALVTPAHQFPMGAVLSPERRGALIEWAASADRLVIEDDYDAELRYDKAPVPAMQSLAPDLVALTGSVSKTLAPGLRLGWVLLPAHLVSEVVAAKRGADLGCSVTEQATLAQLLGTDEYQRHVRRVRRIYHQRRDDLLGAINEHLPSVPVFGVNAGLHLVLELGSRAAEQTATEFLAGSGVSAMPLSSTYRGDPSYGVVVGTARTSPADIRALAMSLSGTISA